MDKGKRPGKLIGAPSNNMYMDLKEILRERALAFLPAKSLCRFKGVCRDWKLKISTPFFAHSQTNCFHTMSGLFCQSNGSPPTFISLDEKAYGVPDPSLNFFPEEVDIRASSNGLLCCQGHVGDKAYYICNPATKQLKKLPKPNGNHGRDPVIVLIHEPSLLDFMADYKLVCAFPSADFDDATEFEIYSSASGSWNISGEILFGRHRFQPRSGVYVDGVVYWRTMHSIVAFDLVKERSKIIEEYYCGKDALCAMFKKLCKIRFCGPKLSVLLLSNIYTNTMEMTSGARTWVERPVNFECPLDLQLGASVVLAVDNVVVAKAKSTVFSVDMRTKKTTILHGTGEYGTTCYFPYVNSLVCI